LRNAAFVEGPLRSAMLAEERRRWHARWPLLSSVGGCESAKQLNGKSGDNDCMQHAGLGEDNLSIRVAPEVYNVGNTVNKVSCVRPCCGGTKSRLALYRHLYGNCKESIRCKASLQTFAAPKPFSISKPTRKFSSWNYTVEEEGMPIRICRWRRRGGTGRRRRR
jgi:hypothetical protein